MLVAKLFIHSNKVKQVLSTNDGTPIYIDAFYNNIPYKDQINSDELMVLGIKHYLPLCCGGTSPKPTLSVPTAMVKVRYFPISIMLKYMENIEEECYKEVKVLYSQSK